MIKTLALVATLAAVATPALADEICADRPAKATGTCTVKKGHLSVSDTVSVSTLHGTDQYQILAPTLKYGLTNRLDIEAAMPLAETVSSHSGTITGNGDLTLRAKYKIVYTGALEYAIMPFVRAPIGYHGLSDKVVEGGAVMPIGFRVSPNSTWLLGFDPEVDVLKDKVGNGTHIATQQVVSLTHGLTNRISVAGELWGEYNYDPTRGTIRQYSSDIMFCYVIAKHFEVDTGVNYGLNRNTATQFFVGISKRY
jgi:hypothetical protein